VTDHGVTTELYYSGGWHDITAYVHATTTLQWSRGLTREQLGDTPRSGSATLNVRDGVINPFNPASALYGVAGRNTPIRLMRSGTILWTGTVADWTPSWTIRPVTATTGDKTIATTWSGSLSQLGRGHKPVLPAIRRAIAAAGPVAYWPLADGGGSTAVTTVASGLPAGTPMVAVKAMDWADLAGPAGAARADRYVSIWKDSARGGSARARLTTVSTDHYEIECWLNVTYGAGALPATDILSWSTTGTPINRWRLEISDDEYFGGTPGLVRIVVWYCDDIATNSWSGYHQEFSQDEWHHVRITVRQLGTGFMEVGIYADDDSYIDDEAYSTDSVGAVQTIDIGTDLYQYWDGTDGIVSVAMAHLAVYDQAAGDQTSAGTGFSGELAAVRFARLCDEFGIEHDLIGDADTTRAMGPQPEGELLDLLRECVRTDIGLLFGGRQTQKLVMRTGRSLYRQTPALAFTMTQLVPPLELTFGDATARNDVTAARVDGETRRVTVDTGPMSTQEPPDGVGRYDTQLDTNPATADMLLHDAGMLATRGTVAGPRITTITVNVDAQPALAADLDTLEIGDLITIDDLPVDVHPDTARLIVTKITNTMPTSKHRKVTIETVPGTPYDMGEYDNSDSRYDVVGSTLAAGRTATETTWSIASTGALWSTTATPYDWLVAGERVTVTAMAGAASPQTATVTRSVNGVSKEQAADTPIRLASPCRYGTS
jgi:hypothetical protein